MAIKYYKGTATAVAQVDTFTPGGTIEVGDIFTLTRTGEDGSTAAVSFTATATTVANVAAGLMAAWNASTNALHTPVTASGGVTAVVLTADTAGVPFIVAATTTNGGAADTQTLTRAATTANSGPSDYNTAANWSDSAVPANGDTIIFDGRMSAAISYGLNQTAVTPAEILDYINRTRSIGTSSAALRYAGVTVGSTGVVSNDGSTGTGAFLNIHLGTATGEFTVYNTTALGTGGLAPVNIGVNAAGYVLNVLGGTVWAGKLTPNETGLYATINAIGGILTTGTGTSFTTLNNQGSTVTVEKVATGMTITSDAGSTTLLGDAKVGTINANAGTVFCHNRTTGDDIGTLNMNGGVIDFQLKRTSFTCNVLNIHRGGYIKLFSATQGTWTTTTWDSTDQTDLQIQLKA